jgi:hypothetical protein
MIITLIRHCLYRWLNRILSTRLVSGLLIRSATRSELSASNIILLGLLYASFAEQSTHCQHMNLGVPFCNSIDCAHLSDLLRFESNSYATRRNATLMQFFHRTSYGRLWTARSWILINTATCLVFAMMKIAVYSVKGSGWLCWRSGLVGIAYNNNKLFKIISWCFNSVSKIRKNPKKTYQTNHQTTSKNRRRSRRKRLWPKKELFNLI